MLGMTEQNQLGLKVQDRFIMLSGMFSNREISRRRLTLDGRHERLESKNQVVLINQEMVLVSVVSW